jgi:hypothetical protein
MIKKWNIHDPDTIGESINNSLKKEKMSICVQWESNLYELEHMLVS